MGTEKKFYGLIIPKKLEKVQPKSKSVFESDSDDDGPRIPVRKQIVPPKSAKVKIVEKKLMDDDPSIYEYDKIYDSIKEKTSQQKTEAKKKEPRFIVSLLKAADKRKKDQDRRLEKKIQIERVKEGDEFKDKEAFVTSAYKQKMEEMEKEEERERIQNQLDEMMDVRKQNDLSGFYRHYLKQTVGEEKVPEFGENNLSLSPNVTIKTEPVERSNSPAKQKQKGDKPENRHSRNIRRRASSSSSDDNYDRRSFDKPSTSSSHKSERSGKHEHLAHSSRYSKSGDEEKACENQSRKRPSSPHENKLKSDYDNPDERSRDKPSTSSGHKSEKSRKHRTSVHSSKHTRYSKNDDEEKAPLPSYPHEDNTNAKQSRMAQESTEINEDADDEDIVDSDPEPTSNDKRGKGTDMSVKFKKRTVGEVFNQAQARFFKRMAARGS